MKNVILKNISLKLLNIILKIKELLIYYSSKPKTILNLIFLWGIPFYIFAIIIAKSLRFLPAFLDVTFSLVIIGYLFWHIFQVKKIMPKKAKLTQEEKLTLKASKRSLSKVAISKILLRESIFKFNPYVILIVLDIVFICHFCQMVFM